MFLIPVALFLGAVGLVAFLWSLRSGQFDDLDGAAARVLLDETAPRPVPSRANTRNRKDRSQPG
jgi:cbb3-type cytochrome oxidase maturation protein